MPDHSENIREQDGRRGSSPLPLAMRHKPIETTLKYFVN